MQNNINPITHIITSLQYYDHELGLEHILDRDDLCSRAGCKCTLWGIVCNNFEFEYFDKTINYWFTPLCHASCKCGSSPPSMSVGTNHASSNISTATPAITDDSGLNRTAVGSSGCLAGEDAGWTIQEQASCCPGYSFNTLNPEETFKIHGNRLNSSTITGDALAIGICSRTASQQAISTS